MCDISNRSVQKDFSLSWGFGLAQLWLDEIKKIINAIDKIEFHHSMSSELQLTYKLKEIHLQVFAN
jgi:hypothetical protein